MPGRAPYGGGALPWRGPYVLVARPAPGNAGELQQFLRWLKELWLEYKVPVGQLIDGGSRVVEAVKRLSQDVRTAAEDADVFNHGVRFDPFRYVGRIARYIGRIAKDLFRIAKDGIYIYKSIKILSTPR